jgi:undecaprenyl-diphosphatase
MELVHSAILGIIEGITEFFPISSTAHLILAGHLLNIPNSEALKTFDIVIQFGAILAVVALYFKRMVFDIETMKRVVTAFIPTALLGLVLYPFIKHHLLDATRAILCALFIGGIFLIWFERHLPKGDTTVRELSYTRSFSIGVLQCFSFLPGVSRSGASIIAGMYSGLTRSEAVEFSFLLAVPTMCAATLLDVYKNFPLLLSSPKLPLTVGLLFSFITALFSIQILLKYVKTNNFTAFGVYRIILSIILFAYFYL